MPVGQVATKMGARLPVLAGLDYVPIPGSDPNLVFGVVRATLAGATNNVSSAVLRRLFPVARPEDLQAPWPRPTCFRYDVMVPPWTNVDYLDPQALCRAYDAQSWEGVKDLAIIMNFRFPETLCSAGGPPSLCLIEAYELVRGYAGERLTRERGLATVIAMHVPSRAGVENGMPHVHAIALARAVNGPLGFGAFRSPELCRDSGREIIEAEWHAWRAEHQKGYARRSAEEPTPGFTAMPHPPVALQTSNTKSRRKSRR